MRRSVALRPAAAAEAGAVAEILLASRQAFLPYAPWAHADAAGPRWRGHVLIPSGGVTVACSDGVIVGVLATSSDAGLGWVDQLYLAPGHVGHGIGSLLLAHALRTLPLPVRLYTFQANHRARRFYEHHGFRAIAFSDGRDNEEGCPDVLYELTAPTDPHTDA